MDGVSWRILLEDLDRAYHQVVRGESIDLGPRSTSFQEWAAKFTEFATAGGFDDELDHWRGLDADRAIPVDGSAPNMVGATRSVTVRLSPDESSALLRDVPAVYRTQVNDVLLAALGRALGDWAGHPVPVDLEGHGREELFGADLSRTVGWFTSIFPVVLDVPDGWGAALKSVKEQLRAVPRDRLWRAAVSDRDGARDRPTGELQLPRPVRPARGLVRGRSPRVVAGRRPVGQPPAPPRSGGPPRR